MLCCRCIQDTVVAQMAVRLAALICAWLGHLPRPMGQIPFQLPVPARRVWCCMKMDEHVAHCLHVGKITSHVLHLLVLIKTVYRTFGDVMGRKIVLMLVMNLDALTASQVNSVAKADSV